MDLVRQIRTIYTNYGFKTEIIVAAVRHPTHVLEAALAGADICTMGIDVMQQLYGPSADGHRGRHVPEGLGQGAEVKTYPLVSERAVPVFRHDLDIVNPATAEPFAAWSRPSTGHASPRRSRTRTAPSASGGASPGRREAPTSTRSRTRWSPGATRSPGSSPSRTASRSPQSQGEVGDGGGPSPVVRRGGPPGLRPHRPEPGRRQAAPRHQDADGRRRRDQPLELPAGPGGAQGGAGPGGRVHGRAEARARRRRSAPCCWPSACTPRACRPASSRSSWARPRRSARNCCRIRCAGRSPSPAPPRSAGC